MLLLNHLAFRQQLVGLTDATADSGLMSERSDLPYLSGLYNKELAERGGFKPQLFRAPCFTREIAATAFAIAEFQILR